MNEPRDTTSSPTSLSGVMTLSGLKTGQSAQVSHVSGGRSIVQRLAMLGIRRGVLVTLLHGPGRRGAVLRVGGTRVALGHGVIDNIGIVPPIRTTLQDMAAE